MKRLLLSAAAVLLPLVFAAETQAGEAYYLLMLASQTTPPNPNYSHTFATFVRAAWPGPEPCPTNPTLEPYTISWLPANQVIRFWALLPECGRNFGLHPSLRLAYDTNQRVSLWGPYQIDRDLFDRAMRQIKLLDSGKVQYKANDTGYRADHVSNCIHAVSSIAEGIKLRVSSPGWGETASYAVLLRFQPWLIDRDRVHPWVGSALGLDCYPIIYRSREHPRSGGIRGPISTVLGRGRDTQSSYGPPLR